MTNKNKFAKLSNIQLFRLESKFYDLVHYEIYNRSEQRRIDDLLKSLFMMLKEKEWCLDLGCGTGNITEREVLFTDVLGLDVSIDMLKKLKRKVKTQNLHCMCADCEYLPFKSDVFNFVSGYSMLHHLPNIRLALKEVYRVLKTDGYFYIDHEPNNSHYALPLQYFYNAAASIGRWLVRKKARFPNLINGQKMYSHADYHDGFVRNFLEKVSCEAGFSKSQITTNCFISMLVSPLPLGELLGSKIDMLLGQREPISDFGLAFTIIAKKV